MSLEGFPLVNTAFFATAEKVERSRDDCIAPYIKPSARVDFWGCFRRDISVQQEPDM